jgi:hypothetical protein
VEERIDVTLLFDNRIGHKFRLFCTGLFAIAKDYEDKDKTQRRGWKDFCDDEGEKLKSCGGIGLGLG